MLSKVGFIFKILLIISQISIIQQLCLENQTNLKSPIRGYYKNLMQIKTGVLLSKQNEIWGNNDGICTRDEIYKMYRRFGYTVLTTGQSIQLDLIQNYEINTLKVWLYDEDNRYYRFEVYVQYQNIETKIYETTLGQRIVKITFPDQQVKSFRIFSNYQDVHVIKVEAYYKFQTNTLQ